MNIVGRYDNSSIEIEGTEESLRELSRTIVGLSGFTSLQLSELRSEHDPYSGQAKLLKLALSDDFVHVGRVADAIFICGAPDKLRILAQNIGSLAEQKRQPSNGRIRLHSHLEYYPGHFFLKADSVPLVVTKVECPTFSES